MTTTQSGAATDRRPPGKDERPAVWPIEQFDRWLRAEFVELNTELEQAYFAARSEIVFGPVELDRPRYAILREGAELIARIGQTDQLGSDARERYQLLGAVGFYLAACRRHEVERLHAANAECLVPAWSLATRLGISPGVAPRYVFAHQSLHNPAVSGIYRRFTSLPDEQIFVTHNALGVLAYQRAAHALRAIPAMGVSSPMAGYQLEQAKAALEDVLRFNRALHDTLDVDRFFYNIRPYFKPYRVGERECRGTNAGDSAAVNEIDLLLGLCSPTDAFYQQLLAEKYPYLPPEDQPRLRDALTGESLLDRFLTESSASPVAAQLRGNGELFLAACRAHGAAYTFHHHQLVKPFLEQPAAMAPPDRLEDLTASGPPLQVVMARLERLSHLRAAHDRPGLTTARASLAELRALLHRDA